MSLSCTKPICVAPIKSSSANALSFAGLQVVWTFILSKTAAEKPMIVGGAGSEIVPLCEGGPSVCCLHS